MNIGIFFFKNLVYIGIYSDLGTFVGNVTIVAIFADILFARFYHVIIKKTQFQREDNKVSEIASSLLRIFFK